MIKNITFKNYRSFKDEVSVPLSPFTLIIGPNGAGKSNLLKLIRDASTPTGYPLSELGKVSKGLPIDHQRHFNARGQEQTVRITNEKGLTSDIVNGKANQVILNHTMVGWYALYPSTIGKSEQIRPNVKIGPDGSGAVSVLDELKTGDREDLFDTIESQLKNYIPTIVKLSTRTSNPGQKALQVTEAGISTPIPVEELSEGTQLILLILTIIHQKNSPKVILLEDIDRGLHPRLFQRIVEMLRETARSKSIRIIATTHNPYLLDEFDDDEGSVLIVEKINASSSVTRLTERVSNTELEEDALGSLWYGGFLGGVPSQQ